MSSSSSSSSSDKRRKGPSLVPEDFAAWEMQFQAHVGYAEWKLFQKVEPVVDEAHLATLLDGGVAGGAATHASRAYEREVRHDLRKWNENNDKIRQALVESLCENKQTKLMALEFQDKTTPAFYAALKSRLKDTSSQSLNFHTGILNGMKCLSNETRVEFSNRLIEQFLVVINLGGVVTDATRVERLLNGLKAHPKYSLEANLLELLPNHNWDTITNQLRQYDRSDANLKQESANAAMPVICHVCNAVGHKAPDCPQRKQGGKGRGHGGKSGGKGGGGRGYAGAKGGKRFGGKGGGGRGSGYKGGKGNYSSSNTSSRICNLCQDPGHFAYNCPHAQEFASVLAARKRMQNNGGNHQKQRRVQNQEEDNGYGEYSMMMRVLPEEENSQSPPIAHALSAFTAVFDSGSSAHCVMPSCLPDNTVIDGSTRPNIQTASSDTVISTLGRASSGLVKNALVVGEKALAKNLVSIPSLDRAGYTTTFANGEGVVTDPHGNVIARAPLQNSNLYEFDIRQLFEQVESALLGSVLLDEKEINTWHLRLGHRNESQSRTQQ